MIFKALILRRVGHKKEVYIVQANALKFSLFSNIHRLFKLSYFNVFKSD